MVKRNRIGVHELSRRYAGCFYEYIYSYNFSNELKYDIFRYSMGRILDPNVHTPDYLRYYRNIIVGGSKIILSKGYRIDWFNLTVTERETLLKLSEVYLVYLLASSQKVS